jgi:hypothetical protein
VQDELIRTSLFFAVRFQGGSRFLRKSVDELFVRKMKQNHLFPKTSRALGRTTRYENE